MQIIEMWRVEEPFECALYCYSGGSASFKHLRTILQSNNILHMHLIFRLNYQPDALPAKTSSLQHSCRVQLLMTAKYRVAKQRIWSKYSNLLRSYLNQQLHHNRDQTSLNTINEDYANQLVGSVQFVTNIITTITDCASHSGTKQFTLAR
jgi:paraquat-inducible protein B